jgi:hypothetical protein
MSNLTKNNRISRSLALVTLMFTALSAAAFEKPEFTVIYTDGDIEYRRYESYLVSDSVVEVSSDYREAGERGVALLLDFRGDADISLTLPIEQTVDADGWRVSMMLPREFTIDSAPVSADPRIRIREVPSRVMAVVRFSGRWTEENFGRQIDKLIAATDAGLVERVSDVQTAVYNPPVMPPFLRHNEVMVEVGNLPLDVQDSQVIRQAANY